MLVYYESAVQGKGAWGGGSLSGHKEYNEVQINIRALHILYGHFILGGSNIIL